MIREPDPAAGPFVPSPSVARKGRGGVTIASGRFERETRVSIDDDWPGGLEGSAPLRTVVGVDTSRTVIARNNSPGIPFDRSINLYRGCEHGCIYCFARSTHAYIGLSPGPDFETKLFPKPDAPALFEKELGKPSYTAAPSPLARTLTLASRLKRSAGSPAVSLKCLIEPIMR